MIISGCDDFRSWGKDEPFSVAKDITYTPSPAQQWNRNQVSVPLKDRAITIEAPKAETYSEELSSGIAQINSANSGRTLYQNEYGKEVAKNATPFLTDKVYNKNQIQPVNPGIKIRAPIILTEDEIFKGARNVVKSKLEQALKGNLNLEGYIKICDTMIKLVKTPADKLWWESALARLNRHRTRMLIYERQGRDTTTPFIDNQIETLKSEIDEKLLSSNMLNLLNPLLAPPPPPQIPPGVPPGAPPPPPPPPAGVPPGAPPGDPDAPDIVDADDGVDEPLPIDDDPDIVAIPVDEEGDYAPAGEAIPDDEADDYEPLIEEDALPVEGDDEEVRQREDELDNLGLEFADLFGQEVKQDDIDVDGVEIEFVDLFGHYVSTDSDTDEEEFPQILGFDPTKVAKPVILEEEEEGIEEGFRAVVPSISTLSTGPYGPQRQAPSLPQLQTASIEQVPRVVRPPLSIKPISSIERTKKQRESPMTLPTDYSVESVEEEKRPTLESAFSVERGKDGSVRPVLESAFSVEPTDKPKTTFKLKPEFSIERESERKEERGEEEKTLEAEAEARLIKPHDKELVGSLQEKALRLVQALGQLGRESSRVNPNEIITTTDIGLLRKQIRALQQNIDKGESSKVKRARDLKAEKIEKAEEKLFKARADEEKDDRIEALEDELKYLRATTSLRSKYTGDDIQGTGLKERVVTMAKKRPVFDDTIDYVATALDLWDKCKNASKANPKKGPCGKMGKGKIKKMTQKEAMMTVEKLQKKLVKLS
jgi:hypothetical protein